MPLILDRRPDQTLVQSQDQRLIRRQMIQKPVLRLAQKQDRKLSTLQRLEFHKNESNELSPKHLNQNYNHLFI